MIHDADYIISEIEGIFEPENLDRYILDGDKYLVMYIPKNGADIVILGNIDENSKEVARNKARKNRMYQIMDNIYRMYLLDRIYLFRMFDRGKAWVYVGACAKLNDLNRLAILDHQSQFLQGKMNEWKQREREFSASFGCFGALNKSLG